MHTQYLEIKEDNKLPKMLSAKKTWKLLKIWSTKGFSSVVTNLAGLKPGQGVLPSGLQTLPYNLGNMHNLASKIREDTTLQTSLTFKQTEEILPSLKTGSWALFRPPEKMLSELKNFWKFANM
jgi:hypothetical protein